MTLWLSIVVVAGLSLPALLCARSYGSPSLLRSDTVRGCAIGTLAVFASLYPYWVFGPYSAIGWYDEHDAVIPIYLQHLAATSGADFSHGFAGGTLIRSAFPDIGTAYLDLYLLLLQVFDPWFASLLYRLAGMSILYCGVYLTAQRLVHAPFAASVAVGLIAVFATAFPYAWALGGYGWGFSLVPWIPLLLLADVGAARRLGLAVAFGVLAATTVTPIFFAPWAVAYGLLAVLWLRRGEVRAVLHRNLPAIAAIMLIMGINQLPTLRAVLDALDQSSRYLKVDSPAALASLFSGGAREMAPGEALSNVWAGLASPFFAGLQIFSGGFSSLNGFPPTILFTFAAIVGVIWIGVHRASWRYALIILAPVAVGMVLTLVGSMFSLPIISVYRWNQIYFTLVFLFALAVAELLAGLHAMGARGRLATRFAAAVLLSSSLLGAGLLSQRGIEDLDRYGGWQTLGHYSGLSAIAAETPLVRGISMPGYRPKPMIGPHYGLDVLDGVRRNFTWRRVAFWFETLRTPPIANWHTHRHALPAKLDGFSHEALELANVGFLLSDSRLAAPYLLANTTIHGVRLSGALEPPFRWITRVVPDVHLVPDLFVYRLPGAWDRVFSPSAVEPAGSRDFDLAYFRRLRQLPRHSLLVPANAPTWLAGARASTVTIKAVRKGATGLSVSTGGEAGLVVYNQEHANNWRARCASEELPLTAVNAIMMVVLVPEGCREIEFAVSTKPLSRDSSS